MSFKGAKIIYGWSLEGCVCADSLFPGDFRAFGLEIKGFDLFGDGSMYLPKKISSVERCGLSDLVNGLSVEAKDVLASLGNPRLVVLLIK